MRDAPSEGDLQKRAVFLIGLPGSGKSTAAAYLEHLGFVTVSASDCIRALCRKSGIALTRENLSIYGQSLVADRGHEYFAELLLAQAGNAEMLVFEGIRPPEVLIWLKNRIHKTRVILIESAEQTRLDRLLLARGEDELSYRKVMAFPMEQDIVKTTSLVDETVRNDSDVNEFYANLKRSVLPML